MKKNKALGYIVLATVFVLVNIIVFVLPTIKTATFWIAYVFMAIAMILQITVWRISFKTGSKLKSKFLGLPLAQISTGYLIIQLLSLAVFTSFPLLPIWISIMVNAVILGFSVIYLITTEVGKSEVSRVEEKVKIKRKFINDLQLEINMIVKKCDKPELKSTLTKLSEKVRFSDPMSDERLNELEEKITTNIAKIKTVEDVRTIELLLDERNEKIKNYK